MDVPQTRSKLQPNIGRAQRGFNGHKKVALLPVPLDDSQCTECMRLEPERYRVIYTRKPEDDAERDASP